MKLPLASTEKRICGVWRLLRHYKVYHPVVRALPLFPLKLLGTAGSGEGKKAAITLRGVKEQLTEHRIPPQSTRTPFQRTKTTKNRVVYQLIVEKHQVAHAFLSLLLSPRHSSSLSLLHTLCWLVPWVALVPMWEPSRPSSLTQLTAWKAPWLALFERHPSPSVLARVSSYFTRQINNSATSMTLERAWVSVWTTAIAGWRGTAAAVLPLRTWALFLRAEGISDWIWPLLRHCQQPSSIGRLQGAVSLFTSIKGKRTCSVGSTRSVIVSLWSPKSRCKNLKTSSSTAFHLCMLGLLKRTWFPWGLGYL